jgi:uncharacterized protein involved in exopolysaccharide biosynthesis
MSNSSPSQLPHDLISNDDEVSFLNLLEVIAVNMRLLVVGPIIAGLIAFIYSFTITPTFTSKTTLIPPGQNISGGAAALLGQLGGLGNLLGGDAVGGKTPTAQYIAYLESNILLDKLVEQFNLVDHYKAKNQEQARQALMGSSQIVSDKKSGLISIQVTDKDPMYAANLANAYVGALSQMLGNMALQEAKYRRNLLEQQINEATEKSYRSPFVREAIIQSIVREYETALLDQKKDRPYIQQVDIAEVSKPRYKPKRFTLVAISAIATCFILLFFVFVRNAYLHAEENLETKLQLQRIFNNFRSQLPW